MSKLAKRPMGRPPEKMNLEVIGKLEEAFNNLFNIQEACRYAGIAPDVYYYWLNKDEYFSNKMAIARSAPMQKAKSNVLNALNEGELTTSRWVLERRDPDFKAKGEMDLNHGVKETREKLKDFLDDDNGDDGGAEHDSADGDAAGAEMAEPAQDISE